MFENLLKGENGGWRTGVPIALIVLLSCGVYANTLHNTFHLDDEFRVVNNPGIEKVQPLSRHFVDRSTMSTLPRITSYRPLLPLTLSLNHAVSGYSLPGFHLVNIGIHTLSAIIIYLLCLELLGQTRSLQEQTRRRKGLALVVAAVFVVHPVSGYPVNYISGRDLLMMELFLMSSFLIYVRMRRLGDSWRGWVFVFLLWTLARFSKQNAIIMPALVFMYEWTVRQSPILGRAIWLRTLPFVGFVVGFSVFTQMVINTSVLGHVLTHQNLQKKLVFAIAQLKLHLFHYGFNFIWPLNVMEGHYIPRVTLTQPGPWLGLVFILSTLYLAWRLRQSAPLISFCILAYWVLLVPSSSIFPIRIVADYRPYPSSVFLYLGAGIVAFSRFNPKALAAVCLSLLVYLTAITVYINTTWKTEESFWGRSVAGGGGSYMAHQGYAAAVSDLKVREKHLRKAVAMNPKAILGRLNLGITLIHQGKMEEGLEMVKGAVAQKPKDAQSHYWLARAYHLTGHPATAAESAATAANLNPIPQYQYLAGFLMQRAKRYEDSIPFLQAVLGDNPNYENAGLMLGIAHQTAGRNQEALAAYETYLEKKPDDYRAQFNMGYFLMKLGQCGRAIPRFKNTLKWKPDYHEAHRHLAACYQSLGKTDEAERHLAIWKDQK